MDVAKIDLAVVTPDREVVSETVDELILPGIEGYLGVQPGHAPLLTALQPGEVAYRQGGTWRYLAVSAGFVEVLRHRVTILADTCERAEEIDLERAEQALQNAEKTIREMASEHEFRQAQARLKKAMARIQVRRKIG